MNINDYIKANWVLFKQIYNDDIVLDAVRKEINSDSKKLIKYSEALLDGKWSKLEGMPPLFILSTLAISLKPVFDKFIKMGFSESVFYDTMSDVKIWGEDYRTHHNGDIGVSEINWLQLHFSCQIFKIGRLQYQISKYYFEKSTEYNGVTFKYGDRCYNIHIPRGAKLDSVSCKKSITLAIDTLEDIFRDIQTDIMMCHSWLLSPYNQKFVAPNSNIAKFAKMFKIVGESDEVEQHFRWIFDIREDNKIFAKCKKKNGYYYNLENFTPKTSLQVAAKNYIMAGGELSGGKGLLDTKDIIG